MKLEKGKFYNIIAEFNNTEDIGINKLYIDGVKQDLSYIGNNESKPTLWDGNGVFTIGGATVNDGHDIDDKTVIDEVKIFKKSLNSSEINSVSNSHKIPELRGEIVNNSYPKLTWATEILPENILYQFGFEEDEQDGINLVYNNGYHIKTGGQEFTSEDKVGGNYSLMTPTTHPDKGNMVNQPFATTSNSNALYYNSLKLGFDQGIPISCTYKAKTNKSGSSINLYGNWAYDDVFSFYNSYTLEDYPAGTQYIKVSNSNIFPLAEKGYVHITLDQDPANHEQNLTGSIVDMENGIFKLSHPLKRDMPKGTQLRQRKTVSMFSFPIHTIVGDNNWNLYNANAIIEKTVGIDWHLKPQILRQSWIAKNDLYIDDIVVGHATKVKLYRNNSLVYEGYNSEFNDTISTDKANPNSINSSSITSIMEIVNHSTSERKIKLNFDEVEDNGTSYNYNITAVSSDGVETPKSETKIQTVTSGIKGYSYVIDKSPTTLPNNIVNTTSTNIEHNVTDTGTYYLHIKSIDNAGNISGTTHHKIDIPTLTSQDNPIGNFIRLDWALGDKNNKTFKVYQQKEGSNDFQSISLTDLSSTKKIKVLNIYPDSRYDVPFKEISFTDWKGNNYTLPESASLKQWMEEPKEDYPKGYGMGIIEVDIVSQSEFNLNPNSYLKNTDGTWKYDVMANGFGDGNGGFDYTDESISLIRSFIQDGRGYLVGHDTIIGGINRNTNNLRDLFNMKLSGDENVGSISHIKGNQVNVIKKGLLLNYPHEIGDIGTILDVPTSHSTAQLAYGDIWMTYKNPIGTIATDNNGNGTNNFYLTSFNNTAMIQTGHYIRGFNEDPTPGDTMMEATTDEKKTLANTLFYLNQLSSETYLDDYSGQDVKSPDMPQIYEHNFTEDGFINLNFNSVNDNGSTYKYYVESQTKDNNSLTLSNVVSETITSGIKGYSFVVDSNPNTVPDSTIEQSTSETIRVKTNNNDELYVHIKAIDNVGNASETYHYRITDTTKPTLELSLAPSSWTNGSVIINAKATDSESGIKHLILPNGNVVKGNTGSYTVNQNGKYYFKAIDYMGNETISSITVTNIDKKKPSVTINNNQNWTNKDVEITITATDE